MVNARMFFIAGLIRSPVLYGLLSLPVCVFGLDVTFETISDAATSSEGGFLEWFYTSVFLSMLAYPVLLVLHAVTLWAPESTPQTCTGAACLAERG